MKGATHTSVYIPYTITGVRAGDGGPYSSGAPSVTLTDLTPSFSFVVAGLGSETSAYPADTYSDALTLTVTPV
jgi:hypothetical protein